DHALPHIRASFGLVAIFLAAICAKEKRDIAPIEIQRRQFGQHNGRNAMRSLFAVFILATMVTIALPTTYANAQEFHAKFSGINVVDVPVLSQGQATITLNLNKKLQSLRYTLTYSGLSANVFQIGIHFAKKHNNGGIVAFLCSNGGFPPGTQTCPAASS